MDFTMYDGNQDYEDYLIRIVLSRDRNKLGTLELFHKEKFCLFGPFPIIARSGNNIAQENNNQSRNSLYRYGDTPTGVYHAILKPSYAVSETHNKSYGKVFNSHNKLIYGREELIQLIPISGNALLARDNGRSGYYIQSGDIKDYSLYPTSGNIRFGVDNMLILSNFLIALAAKNNYAGRIDGIVEIIEINELETDNILNFDSVDKAIDPIDSNEFNQLFRYFNESTKDLDQCYWFTDIYHRLSEDDWMFIKDLINRLEHLEYLFNYADSDQEDSLNSLYNYGKNRMNSMGGYD